MMKVNMLAKGKIHDLPLPIALQLSIQHVNYVMIKQQLRQLEAGYAGEEQLTY